MDINNIINGLTLDEKILMLALENDVYTRGAEEFGIKRKAMIDGPHGLRFSNKKDSTLYPNSCALAASWDTEIAELMGDAYANDCIEHNVDMVFGPGINIKRTPLCGRNFEYFSEDPVLSGEMAAGYINGLQKKGIGACLKHFAVNNQEKFRCVTNVEIDERTLREIYLKAFEIAIKKSNPYSVMCAYNKINAVWCSENKFLLTEILKNEWGYKGFVISDYFAVHDPVKAINAGLDMHMPEEPDFLNKVKKGIEEGKITEGQIDEALKNILSFLLTDKVQKRNYDRAEQHKSAVKIAEESIVLIKNDNDILPITNDKYKKIAVIGEFAVNPLISGQGSAEVYPDEMYVDSPLKELKKHLPNTEIEYREMFKKGQFSEDMLWPKIYNEDYKKFIQESDIVIVFAGCMVSEHTEKFDRRNIELNPNYDLFIEFATELNKNVVVVLQNGSAVTLGDWRKRVLGIVEIWLGGEGAGSAIANVLCGKVNPSGKLPETFPTKLRTDMEYPGDGFKVEYNEKLSVGYRYYDRHTDEIAYPFGHGLSYTEFSYSDIKIVKENGYSVSFKLKNTGKTAGSEVTQLYVSDLVSVVKKPEKELKKFKKIYLEAGEEKEVSFILKEEDFSYYNVSLHSWVAENGWYRIEIGSSSRDIRLSVDINYDEEMPYTVVSTGKDMMGDTSQSCFGC